MKLCVCQHCGIEFKARDDRPGVYCSRSCTHHGRQKRSQKICETCGKQYIAKTCRDSRYCSIECRASGREKRILHTCPQCGVQFNTKASRDAVYCSVSCLIQHKGWIVGQAIERFYSTSAWRKSARLAKSRDSFRCHRCGESKNLSVHHCISRSRGGSDDLENLITLCSCCHAKVHVFKRRVNRLNLMQMSY